VDSYGTIAVSSLVNNSVEIVEISGVDTLDVKVVDRTSVRRTKNVEDSLKTTIILDVFLGI